uniref:APA family fibronectin-binding glycoprotein n=2 Tax=Mycolicibacterium llatzerense TaxID=280871 RepID=UPI003899407D
MTTSEEFPTATRIRRAVRLRRLPATAIALLCAVAAATHGADQQQAQVWAQSRAVDLMTTDVPLPNSGSPADPNRIHDDLGRFSFTTPVGWVRSANPKLTYGTTLLTNPGHPDGVILVGPLDLKLFASSYPSHPDNTKAAIRLASDMGTFLMPYPGNRINWDTQPFSVNGLPAATSYFETKYEDARHEDSQLWVGVVGHDVNRFFALWRGTASTPIDRAAAQALAESIDPD